MSIAIPEFWKLVMDSQLLSPEQCQSLGAEYGHVKGAAQEGNARTLSEWLISRNILSRYQAKILLAGHAGPFVYGDYQVYDRLESGRYAGAFRAVHSLTRHPVLLHFLTGARTQDPAAWAASVARARAMCQVKHPNVQRYFEIVDLTTFKFMVSEDLEGQTLAQLLAAGRLEVADACRTMRITALGLLALHQSGMIHGDVRPHNVWIEPSGNLKLLVDPIDYGCGPDLAHLATDAEAALRTDYLAPEFVEPGKVPDVLTDVYALGCTTYETLAGRPPFEGGDVTHKLRRHAEEPIQPLREFGVPDAVDQLVSYLMAKNPGVRYQDVGTVIEQVAPFIDPALVNPPVTSPIASLPGYEAALQTKQTAAPASSAPVAGPAAVQPAATVQSAATVQPAAVVQAAAQAETPAPKFNINPDAGPAIAVTSDRVSRKSPAFNTTATEPSPDAEKRKIKQVAIGLGATAILLIGGLVALQMLGGSGEDPTNGQGQQTAASDTGEDNPDGTDPTVAQGTETQGTQEPQTDTEPPSEAVPAEPVSTQQVVTDDGQLPWASPTDGTDVKFQYVPPDSQVHMMIRPASMLAQPEGSRVMESMGPTFASARARWERASGFPLADIDQLIIAMHDNSGRFPRPSFVVRLLQPVDKADLLAKWGNPSATEENGGTYYKGDSWSYFIPGTDPGVFVMGSEQDIKEVASTGGAAPPIRRESERLRQVSDRDRHFTMILSPNYLFSDGRELLSGNRQKLRDPISWFLGDSLKACMVSMHFDETFYVEARMFSDIGTDPHTLASEMRDRLEEVPTKVEDYLVRINPHPYWKRFAFRFPNMISAVHNQTRVGVENDQAIVNCVLPSPAAHNLAFGTSMALDATPGAAVAAGPSKPTGPKTLEELLARKMTLSFDQKSLEFSMRDVETDMKDTFPNLPFDFKVKIIGGDLEKDGITRNQQVRDINVRDKAVSEVLTTICVTAAATGKAPNSPEQKLIWVIGPDPEDASKQIVLITTRNAAAAKNYTLPAVFQP